MTERYVELHATSAFSFLEGASQPEELMKQAVELEMPAMARSQWRLWLSSLPYERKVKGSSRPCRIRDCRIEFRNTIDTTRMVTPSIPNGTITAVFAL
jgi:hypothetical protein